jgi:translocating chain-associated membrane protein 1
MVQKKKASKAASFPSHEFFIQNHGDIAVTIMALFFIGLVFQPTHEAASKILFLNYNISSENVSIADGVEHSYNYFVSGPLDWFNILYYAIGCVVVHALIQEYILDKAVKKSHLSKSKLSKFHESAHLAIFYLMSLGFIGYTCYLEKFPVKISFLWDDYPHIHHMLLVKLFFLTQISYWLHVFPEFYFQKARKEEIPQQVTYASLYLVFLTAGYFMNFTRLAMFLTAVHYVGEAVFHIARFSYICESAQVASVVFFAWGVIFVVSRLFTIIIAFLVFWVGLAKSELPSIDVKNGNFNTATVRTTCLAAVILLQMWLMWNFIHFQLKFFRDRQLGQSADVDFSSDETTQAGTEPNTPAHKRTTRANTKKVPEVPLATSNGMPRVRPAAAAKKVN